MQVLVFVCEYNWLVILYKWYNSNNIDKLYVCMSGILAIIDKGYMCMMLYILVNIWIKLMLKYWSIGNNRYKLYVYDFVNIG